MHSNPTQPLWLGRRRCPFLNVLNTVWVIEHVCEGSASVVTLMLSFFNHWKTGSLFLWYLRQSSYVQQKRVQGEFPATVQACRTYMIQSHIRRTVFCRCNRGRGWVSLMHNKMKWRWTVADVLKWSSWTSNQIYKVLSWYLSRTFYLIIWTV